MVLPEALVDIVVDCVDRNDLFRDERHMHKVKVNSLHCSVAIYSGVKRGNYQRVNTSADKTTREGMSGQGKGPVRDQEYSVVGPSGLPLG